MYKSEPTAIADRDVFVGRIGQLCAKSSGANGTESV
jgi:hypothetical protein